MSSYLPIVAPDPIPSADISVVIQGPLYRDGSRGVSIRECLDSLRRHVAGAELIVATWQGESVSGLDADRLLILDDPGTIEDISDNCINLQRQVVSTYAGLQAATRPWVLKMRADIALTGKALLVPCHYGEAVPHSLRHFSSPITILNYFVRDPAKAPMLFHVSDIIQFGRRDDLLDFWAGHAFTAEHLLIEGRPCVNPFGHWHGFTRQRIVPEQALMLRWMKRHGMEVHLARLDTVTYEAAKLSEQLICSQFHMIDAQAAAIRMPAHFGRSLPSIRTLYRAKELPSIACQAFGDYRLRYTKILINRYIGAFFSPYWHVMTGSMLLRRFAPKAAAPVRAMYRQMLGYQR